MVVISIAKAVRRALSLKGTLSVHSPQPRWRLLHDGSNPGDILQPNGSHAKPFLKPANKVDPVITKIDEVARKAVLVEYTRGLLQEEKTKIVSPHLLGIALPLIIGASCIALLTVGYQAGFYETTEDINRRVI